MLLVGRKKIAKHLGLTWNTVRKIHRTQGLPLVKLGGQWSLDTDHLAQWLKQRARGTNMEQKQQQFNAQELQKLWNEFVNENQEFLNEMANKFKTWAEEGDAASIHFMTQCFYSALKECNTKCLENLNLLQNSKTQ